MYSAMTIAKYIINKCVEIGRPVSNLKLQKILYYVQGEYMKYNNGRTLFEDDIEAWQYGPVVPEVYYNYNGFASSNIILTSEVDLPLDIKNIIDPVIKDKSRFNAWTLVEQTHSELPWKKAYIGMDKNVIKKEFLQEYFCN